MICPACGTWNDPALSPSGRIPPKDWDPICCANCATIFTIDSTRPGNARIPVVEDWEAWQADPRLARWLTAVAALADPRDKDTDA